jgi:hypothetical protein
MCKSAHYSFSFLKNGEKCGYFKIFRILDRSYIVWNKIIWKIENGSNFLNDLINFKYKYNQNCPEISFKN